MRTEPQAQEIYHHFKGNDYQIITIAIHSETGEKMVVYKALYGDGLDYVRPLGMFMEEVDTNKYPDAGQTYRFELKARSTASKETSDTEEAEDYVLDPKVLEYLDAETIVDRLSILTSVKGRITDDMINTMAMAQDISIKEGSIEERYESLYAALKIMEKYECTRLR